MTIGKAFEADQKSSFSNPFHWRLVLTRFAIRYPIPPRCYIDALTTEDATWEGVHARSTKQHLKALFGSPAPFMHFVFERPYPPHNSPGACRSIPRGRGIAGMSGKTIS
jgi:hypothetical protein